MCKYTESPKGKWLPPEIREVSEVYYESLSCPRSLTAAILLRYGEYDQVASLKAKPLDYVNASDYHRAALASDWLRKYPGLPVKVDPEVEAKRSWYQSETECARQNVRALVGFDGETALLLNVAADFIKDVLGPCPLDLVPRFGPGATASDAASATTVLDKVSSRPTVTQEALCLLPLWGGTAWERSHLESSGYKKSSYEPLIVKGNTFFTVPKTALTHRGCAKGPSINVSYQLSVGRIMRRRFKDYLALDLAQGQQHHQLLARKGSMTGEYATLDSERASDTMSYSLVKLLLGKAGMWFELLKTLREPYTRIDGTWVELEKFSAMGNGYTFELETLVFLSLCYAVAWAHGLGGFPAEYTGLSAEDLVRLGHISVYGDDVIVPAFMGRDVAAVLALFGFTVNLKKSYFEGEFRESCGGDFFNGHAVNTAKLQEECIQPADWFSLHNAVKNRFVDQYPCLNGLSVLNAIKKQLPRQYRSMYGPTFLGDRVLHGWYGPQVGARARTVTKLDGTQTTDGNQWVGRLKTLAPRLVQARFDHYSNEAQLAYILYTRRSEPPTRRPTKTLRYDVTHFEGDYHVIFEDYVPRAPTWLSRSRFARFFGFAEDGSYVG